jgi:hypothetical protein
MKENREGYERLGVQVAELLTAVASVLQRPKQDQSLFRVMQANLEPLIKYARPVSHLCSALILGQLAYSRK